MHDLDPNRPHKMIEYSCLCSFILQGQSDTHYVKNVKKILPVCLQLLKVVIWNKNWEFLFFQGFLYEEPTAQFPTLTSDPLASHMLSGGALNLIMCL